MHVRSGRSRSRICRKRISSMLLLHCTKPVSRPILPASDPDRSGPARRDWSSARHDAARPGRHRQPTGIRSGPLLLPRPFRCDWQHSSSRLPIIFSDARRTSSLGGRCYFYRALYCFHVRIRRSGRGRQNVAAVRRNGLWRDGEGRPILSVTSRSMHFLPQIARWKRRSPSPLTADRILQRPPDLLFGGHFFAPQQRRRPRNSAIVAECPDFCRKFVKISA